MEGLIKITVMCTCAMMVTAAYPFSGMYNRRISGRPRSRLFGSPFPTQRYNTERKKPASRPFTIPGFESNSNLPAIRPGSLTFNGRALIDPIASMYDSPSGGSLQFINGIGDLGFDTAGQRGGGMDVGGNFFNAPSQIQDQFVSTGNLGSQGLGFIDQRSSQFLPAANTRNLGMMEMNSAVGQPLDIGNFGNQMLSAARPTDMPFTVNQGANGLGLQNTNLRSAGISQLGMTDTNSNNGLGGNQFGIGSGGQLGLDSSQMLLGQNQVGIDTNQLGMDGNQIGLSNGPTFLSTDRLGLSGNQMNLGGSQMNRGGNQLNLGGNQFMGSSQMSLDSNQLNLGNGQMNMAGTSQMSLNGNQMVSGLSGNLQDQMGGVMPTQASLTNSRYLAPTDIPQTVITPQSVNSPTQITPTSGLNNGQLQFSQDQNLGAQMTSINGGLMTSQLTNGGQMGNQLSQLGGQISQPGGQLSQLDIQNSQLGGQISQPGGQLSQRDIQNSQLGGQNSLLGGQNSLLGGQNSQLDVQNSLLGGQNSQFGGQLSQLDIQNSQLGGQNSLLGGQNSQLDVQNSQLGGQNSQLAGQISQLGSQNSQQGGQNSQLGGQFSQMGGQISQFDGQMSQIGGQVPAQTSAGNGQLSQMGSQISQAGSQMAPMNGQMSQMSGQVAG